MSKATIFYRDGDKIHSTEHFLSKQELRKIFGTDKIISLVFCYNRKRMRLANRREGKYFVKKNCNILKTRTINL